MLVKRCPSFFNEAGCLYVIYLYHVISLMSECHLRGSAIINVHVASIALFTFAYNSWRLSFNRTKIEFNSWFIMNDLFWSFFQTRPLFCRKCKHHCRSVHVWYYSQFSKTCQYIGAWIKWSTFLTRMFHKRFLSIKSLESILVVIQICFWA